MYFNIFCFIPIMVNILLYIFLALLLLPLIIIILSIYIDFFTSYLPLIIIPCIILLLPFLTINYIYISIKNIPYWLKIIKYYKHIHCLPNSIENIIFQYNQHSHYNNPYYL